MYLPDYVIKALKTLKDNGFEGYAVGGCVRDSLLGNEPGDYDIAVSCPPEKTEECFKGYKVIETGIRHGTVTVVIDKHNLELTSFRRDGEYKDLRRPEDVTFTPDLKEDLSRRDFTINALAYSPEKGITDLFGGMDDLKNRVIRCVGDPEARFNEDALRILRALRFSSVLDFKIEEGTALSAIKNRDNLQKISAERKFTEIKKLLEGKNSAEILVSFKDVLISCIPELGDIPEGTYRLQARRASSLKDAVLSFSALVFPLGSDTAEKVCRSLKTDNAFRNTCVFLTDNAERAFTSLGEAVRFTGANKREDCERLCVFKESLGLSPSVLREALRQKNAASKISELKINGEDLLKRGISGPEIGNALARMLVAVSNGELKNTKSELEKYASELKKNT